MESDPATPVLLDDLAPGGPATDAALSESNARFAILTDAMPQMVWSTLPDGHHDYYNARWYEFTGVPVGSTDGEGWNEMFHADDRERAWARWNHSLTTGEPYEIEYRLRHHSGAYRWTLGRALPVRDALGTITRWIGTCTDIDDQKRTAEQNEILNRELSHRIKNIFAVIGGLIGLSARNDPGVRPFAEQLRGRVAALGRAHEFVRPHSEDSAPTVGPATLIAMLTDLLGAYPALDEGRLTIDGDELALDDRAATPVALVFHELATNSAKYGALSSPDGRVSIAIRVRDGHAEIDWLETGGPAVVGPPARVGFGTRLTEMSIVQQLAGRIERDWARDGLKVRLSLATKNLVRN